MFVVVPASMASPFMPFSGAIPQPSWTLVEDLLSFGTNHEIKHIHKADLVRNFDHICGSGDVNGGVRCKERALSGFSGDIISTHLYLYLAYWGINLR